MSKSDRKILAHHRRRGQKFIAPYNELLLRYLVESCFHHSSASVCADDVSRDQSSFAPPLPHVRGFPALGVLPASPTSLEAFAFLRREPYRPAYSMYLLHQDFEGSLRFLDTSISERAVRLTPVPLP